MCVISGCECLYTPPSRSNLTLWGIIQIVVMAVCGLLCAANLYQLFTDNTYKSTTVYLILVVVADCFIVVGICLILFGLFFSPSGAQIRSGIMCFVVGAICFVVAIIYRAIQIGGIALIQLIQCIILVFLAYILWIQAGRI